MPDFQNIQVLIYHYMMGTRSGKQKHSQNMINATKHEKLLAKMHAAVQNILCIINGK